MNFIIIDYGVFYYKRIADIQKPCKRAGKFVQIRHRNTEYLVFSPKEFTRYHADLAEKFCREKEIAGTYNRQLKRYDIIDPSWVILGGGKFEIDEEQKILRLYDNSMAYGKFQEYGLIERICSVSKMNGYRVEIE
jgi:hypothetical protein